MKKFLSILLTASIILQSLCIVYAGSTNTLLGSPRIMPNSPVYVKQGELNALQIQPRNAVESGDSIVVRVENGTFDRSFVEDEYVDLDRDGSAETLNPFVFRTNKTGSTYDYIIENQLSSVFDTLKKYIGDEGSSYLPYDYRWINEGELEIKLFPISELKVNQNNSDVTQGIPFYIIPLPIISGSNEREDVRITIDDNGSSIRGGNYTYATVDSNADEYWESLKHPLTEYNKTSLYDVERCVNIGANSEIQYKDKPIGFMIQPNVEVNKGSFAYVVIKNGKFDKSLVDKCQFITNKSGYTYDEIVATGLNVKDALEKFIGDEDSRFLPYKIEYVDETTLKVELFPIMETKVNQFNMDVTHGIPAYKILLPAISGSEGVTSVAFDGRNADMLSGGYYDVAYIDGYENEDYNTVRGIYIERDIVVDKNSKVLYNNKPNAIFIKPTKAVELGDSILIKIKDGTFDESMMDMCKYRTNKNGYDYDYIVNNPLGSVKDTLNNYVKNEGGRYIPYSLEYIDQNTIKANLYPVTDECLSLYYNHGYYISDGIPVYKISLPAVSGNEDYTQIVINSNGSSIPNAGYYCVARRSTDVASKVGNATVATSTNSSYAGNIIFRSNGHPVNIQIQPNIGVEEGTSITLKVKNGHFDKSLVEDAVVTIDGYKEENPFIFQSERTRVTYDEIVAAGLSVYDTLKLYIGDEDSRLLPYKMEYVDESTAKVTLYPLPDNKAGRNNYDITQGIPIYSIDLPVIAGESEGDVTVSIDGTNTVIGSHSDLVIANNYTDKSATAIMYVVISDIKDVTGTIVNIPDITVKENFPNSSKNGELVFTLDNGYVFDKTSSPKLLAGMNCSFDDLSPKEFTENKLVFEINKDEIFFSDDRICSYILRDAVVKGTSGLDVVVKLTGSAIPNTDTSLTVAKGYNSSTEISTELSTENTTDLSTETTTIAATRPSSGGGGGGGGGSSYVARTTTTTTEATTESTTSQVTKVEETSTEATTVSKEVRVSIGSNDVVVGNNTYSIDAAAYIQPSTNSTMIPLRFISVALIGENVDSADTSNAIKWDTDTKTATISYGNNVVSFKAGSNVININGNEKTMANNAVAEIKDSRIYIPFRALGEAFGVAVDWDSTSKTAIYKL